MSSRTAALVVFAAALLLHAGYWAARGSAVQADGAEYWKLAENLRQHHTFALDLDAGPTIRRAPGFPFLIAATGSVTATIAIQVLMAAAVALFIFLLATKVTSQRAALALALLYALHPSSLYWTRMLHSEASFTFFSIAGLYLLSRRSPSLGGLALGLAALTRPVGAPFLLVAAVAVGWRSRRDALLVLGMGLLVIAPWIVRSSRLAHRFVLLSATSTVNLYVGTQTGQPIYSDEWFQRFLREDPCGHAFNTAKNPVESVAADDVCTSGAKQSIRANPKGYLMERPRALVRLLTSSFDLTLDNTRSTGELRAQGRWGTLLLKILLFVGFCVVPLLLGGVGLRWDLATMFWLYSIAIFLPGYTEFRYFHPAVPALFVSAAVGLGRIWRA